jgi:Domain of unknown function (DUF4279)
MHNSNRGEDSQHSEEQLYFYSSATLRILGTIPDLEGITQRLGIAPTGAHHKGDRRWEKSLFEDKVDMWSCEAPVMKTEPLHVHIDSLWKTFRDRKDYPLNCV